MLIRYTIENFLSFGEKCSFSMIPGLIRSHPSHKTNFPNRNEIDILKLGIIYGANASGKSNLIKSLRFLQQLVLEGTKPEQSINLTPHKLHADYIKKPSRFEVEFRKNSKNYAYGVILNSTGIIEEWLYEINKTSDIPIFERIKTEDDLFETHFKSIKFKSNKEKEFLNFIARGTRSNQLFLTECFQRNVSKNVQGIKPITDAISWFNNSLTIIFPSTKFGGLLFELESNEDFRSALQKYLKNFDTGIDGIELMEVDFYSLKDFPGELKKEIATELKPGSRSLISNPERQTYSLTKNKDGTVNANKVIIKHKISNSNESIHFELSEESDGTQRLIDLIPALIDVSKSERVFIVDELDRSLHPNLSRNFLGLFLELSKGLESQLIVTTHDANLLDLKYFRKDEIWFVEKSTANQSKLFSLNDFNIRFDKRIRNDYLLGRFGATPHIKHAIK